jgi:hypothetical protein
MTTSPARSTVSSSSRTSRTLPLMRTITSIYRRSKMHSRTFAQIRSAVIAADGMKRFRDALLDLSLWHAHWRWRDSEPPDFHAARGRAQANGPSAQIGKAFAVERPGEIGPFSWRPPPSKNSIVSAGAIEADEGPALVVHTGDNAPPGKFRLVHSFPLRFTQAGVTTRALSRWTLQGPARTGATAR